MDCGTAVEQREHWTGGIWRYFQAIFWLWSFFSAFILLPPYHYSMEAAYFFVHLWGFTSGHAWI